MVMQILLAFRDWIAQFDPVDVFAVIVLVVGWFWVWRTSTATDNTFAVVDLFMDPYTNKAAASATVYMFFAGVSAWYIIRTVTHGGDPVNALLGVLGIFIAKGAGDRAIAAWGNRTPATAADPEPSDPVVQDSAPVATVETTTKVTKGKK
jgi:hypothetical protein